MTKPSAKGRTGAPRKADQTPSGQQIPPDPEANTVPPGYDPLVFTENMVEASNLWQQAMQRLALGKMTTPVGHTDAFHIGESLAVAGWQAMLNPAQMFDQGINLWRDHLQLWSHTTQRLLGNESAAVIKPDAKDKRFQDPAWNDSAPYDFLKQSYLINARWAAEAIQQVEGLDRHTQRKVSFFLRQMIDALSPSNYLLTNPQVLRLTMESNGENLVKGLGNMLHDIERGDGSLRIRMTDESAFELGTSIATTPGKVVYQNELMQLIQYSPSTETVFTTPLLVMPAWINKYYVLDLRPENSLVKWLVAQGHTVFMISWVNPDESLGRKSFSDYLREGPLAAMDAITKATGEKQVSIMGYCLGGTLLSILLSYLRNHGKEGRVKSATYLTTMVDFGEAGELSVFIDDSQLATLEDRMSERGYLEGEEMAMTFNMLRANDLIWSFVVNNYLLGKDPFPFDLLYWNSDCTRMPAAMHSFYLRNMYQKNLLVKPNGIEVGDTPVNLSKITTPSYILATKEDHIAPWMSAYIATQVYDGPILFTLADSGHIAGVINPPGKGKYGHWLSDKLPPKAQDWLQTAEERSGSWWPHWDQWQQQFAGERIPAREPGERKLKVIEDAPGSYVKKTA